MELQTISTVSIIGTICSILLAIGVPIALMIVGNKKFGAKISSFFIGAGTFVVFALILEQIMHTLVIIKLGLNAQSNEWLYYIYAAAAAAVFEETGRIVAMKFIMKKNFNFPNAFMYGVGHGGIEAIIICGIANIASLYTMIMINTGAIQLSLAALPAETQAKTLEALSTYWTTPSSLFFAAGIERVSAIIVHIGLSLIIYNGLKSNKKAILALAYALHFLVDFIAVSLASRAQVWVIEAIVFVLAVAVFVLSHRITKANENA